MLNIIKSKDNKTVKTVKALRKKSERLKNGCFIAEGKRIAEEAMRFCADRIRFVVVSEHFAGAEQEIMTELENGEITVYEVPDKIFSDIADTDTPQGILAVVDMPNAEYAPSAAECNIVVADGVSEPGNMGTIIRTAEAFGFDGIYTTKGSADLYGQKTVRATMGSIFRMNFRTDCTADDVLKLKEEGFEIAVTSPAGETAVESFERAERQVLVIGNEAHGASRELMDSADVRLKITMDGKAESLNAAVAAGIAMHAVKNCCEKRK